MITFPQTQSWGMPVYVTHDSTGDIIDIRPIREQTEADYALLRRVQSELGISSSDA